MNNNYFFYLTDHLGNNRVVANKDGGIIQKNHYYPFGMAFAEGTHAEQGNQPYKYNNKELDQMHGLNMYDYSARYMDGIRFTTIDPLAEKYYSISPYVYCNNNPLKFIDLRGDSISVAEKYRDLFNVALSSVFKDHAKNFSYTSRGMLVYNGSTKGMSKEQTKAFKGLSSVISESTTTNVIYEESTQIEDQNGNSVTINASQGGGALAVLASENNLTQNTILIDPKMHHTTFSAMAVTSAYYKTPVNPANGPRFIPTNVRTNMADLLYHEIGHVIYQGKPQNNVINYNNIIRSILGMQKRPYDETHSKNIK